MDGARWYLVKTRKLREEQVEAVLTARGVEVYLPRTEAAGPRQGPYKRDLLLHGYLFVRLAVPSQQWLAARSAPGVEYFVGIRTQGRPEPVPDRLVEEVRAWAEEDKGAEWLPDPRSVEQAVVSGRCPGLEAIFDGLLAAGVKT